MTDDVQRQNYQKPTVVSPDIGGVVRARAMAKILNTDLAIIDKRRPEANQIEVMNIIGEVKGRTCILIDDIVDTAGTLCKAADALKERGAKKVVAYCTHPVLSGEAIKNIENSKLDTMVVTNTIPTSDDALKSKRIRVLTIGKMLAEAMRRVSNEESISAMFD
jgi:ribose-phosphate pyrophosphokinase